MAPSTISFRDDAKNTMGLGRRDFFHETVSTRSARVTLARAAQAVAMRAEALSLFRRLHRAAGLMPTSNRASFVRAKVRHEYEAHRGEPDVDRVRFLLRVGETQLDNIKSQAEHLSALFADPNLHARE